MPSSPPPSQMKRPFDQIEPLHNETFNQSHVATSSNDPQTSPLDLSKTSTRFSSSHQTISSDDSIPSSIESSGRGNHDYSKQMSVDCSCENPQIITPPKSEWHYRNKRDLARGHNPFLSGEGPQRTPIRVKVPAKSDQQMYLGIAVVTHDGQFHDSKVIVPPKTRVNENPPVHDNNLNCLQFNACNETDRFDLATRNVYLQITPEEHRAQVKEVRVHMFNLYQNQLITKEIIEAKQLQCFRLAFWFCLFDNKHYIPISERTFSSVIQERKNNTRSNVLQQITTENNVTSVNPYSMVSVEHYNQDDDDDYISGSSMDE